MFTKGWFGEVVVTELLSVVNYTKPFLIVALKEQLLLGVDDGLCGVIVRLSYIYIFALGRFFSDL